jgi:hypothetical protein
VVAARYFAGTIDLSTSNQLEITCGTLSGSASAWSNSSLPSLDRSNGRPPPGVNSPHPQLTSASPVSEPAPVRRERRLIDRAGLDNLHFGRRKMQDVQAILSCAQLTEEHVLAVG